MFSENTKPVDAASATLTANTGTQEGVQTHGFYTVDCVDAQGNVKWSETIKNLVVTSGKNFMLTETFTGSSYTAAWFLGLEVQSRRLDVHEQQIPSAKTLANMILPTPSLDPGHPSPSSSCHNEHARRRNARQQ
jgi:hypothetical protein